MPQVTRSRGCCPSDNRTSAATANGVRSPGTLTRAFALLLTAFAMGIWLDESSGQGRESLSVAIDEVTTPLPAPSMADGLDADQQSSVLKQVAGKYSLARFCKNSIVAPFRLERVTIKNAEGDRIGHQIDLWFVAYGDFDAIQNKNMFAELVDSDDSAEGDGEELSEQELETRGVTTASTGGDGRQESIGYYRFSTPVLDRVIVEGVVRGASISSTVSHFASVRLAEEFNGDAEYPNQWRHTGDQDAGATPYSGYSACAKATKLAGYENGILIECHAVVSEPKEWFGRANLLSSKLPLAVQNTVRRFRRTLSK